MSLPVELRALLVADAGVLALASTRIYPTRLPQEPTFPALTYELIDGDPNNPVNGTQSLHWSRVRINAWGATYGDAYALAVAVQTALNGQQNSTLRDINGQGIRDNFEPAVDAHHHSQDFTIWHIVS